MKTLWQLLLTWWQGEQKSPQSFCSPRASTNGWVAIRDLMASLGLLASGWEHQLLYGPLPSQGGGVIPGGGAFSYVAEAKGCRSGGGGGNHVSSLPSQNYVDFYAPHSIVTVRSLAYIPLGVYFWIFTFSLL